MGTSWTLAKRLSSEGRAAPRAHLVLGQPEPPLRVAVRVLLALTPPARLLCPQHPTDVDYRVMATFTEFYTTLLGFVNFRLYQSLNLHYPPKVGLSPGGPASLPAGRWGLGPPFSDCPHPASQLESQVHTEAKTSEDAYALDSESSLEVRGASSAGPASPRTQAHRRPSQSGQCSPSPRCPHPRPQAASLRPRFFPQKLAALSASLARVVVPTEEEEAEVDEFPADGVSAARLSGGGPGALRGLGGSWGGAHLQPLPPVGVRAGATA